MTLFSTDESSTVIIAAMFRMPAMPIPANMDIIVGNDVFCIKRYDRPVANRIHTTNVGEPNKILRSNPFTTFRITADTMMLMAGIVYTMLFDFFKTIASFCFFSSIAYFLLTTQDKPMLL